MLKSFLTFFYRSRLSLTNFALQTSFMSVSFNKIRKIAIGCIFLLTLGCQRKLSREEVGTELKKAMLAHLENDPHFDSSKVHIKVLDVNYFEDKKVYNCEFRVSMKIPERGLDTVGVMTANISKTFDSVFRKN
jgi:hypothetical protein